MPVRRVLHLKKVAIPSLAGHLKLNCGAIDWLKPSVCKGPGWLCHCESRLTHKSLDHILKYFESRGKSEWMGVSLAKHVLVPQFR